MNRILVSGLAAALGAWTSLAEADATLLYQLSDGSSAPVTKKLSVARFFVRVDSSDAPDEFLLYQAGKFFPLFEVDTAKRTYQRLTPPVKATLGPASRTQKAAGKTPETVTDEKPATAGAEPDTATMAEAPETAAPSSEATTPAVSAAEPAAAAQAEAAEGSAPQTPAGAAPETTAGQPEATPKLAEKPLFRATPATDTVAGINCRIVLELVDGEPAIEHCMANEAALGITEREMRTLARLFVLARERNWDWLGAATEDEEFVSIRSRRLEGAGLLQLASVSTDPLPQGHLRIAREFTEIPYQAQPQGPAEAGPATDQQQAASQTAPPQQPQPQGEAAKEPAADAQ